MKISTTHSLQMSEYELLLVLQQAGYIPEGDICIPRYGLQTIELHSIKDTVPIITINWSETERKIENV